MNKKRKIQKFLLTSSLVLVCTIVYFLFLKSRSVPFLDDKGSENDSSYIIKPYFRGVGKNINLYEINASKAIETSEGSYDLYDVVLKYYFDKKMEKYVSATSISGVFYKQKNILKFVEPVDMVYSAGYRGVAEDLFLDFSKKIIYTNLPFNLAGIKGRIFSKGGVIYNMSKGKAFFYGPVKTLIFNQKL